MEFSGARSWLPLRRHCGSDVESAPFEQKGRHGWLDRVLLLSGEAGVKSRALITFREDLKVAERGCDFRGGGHDLLVVGDELRTGLLGDGDVCGVVGCQPGGGPSGDAG